MLVYQRVNLKISPYLPISGAMWSPPLRDVLFASIKALPTDLL
jgi:hypothetical protein